MINNYSEDEFILFEVFGVEFFGVIYFVFGKEMGEMGILYF